MNVSFRNVVEVSKLIYAIKVSVIPVRILNG
jgi:hypothetical protein